MATHFSNRALVRIIELGLELDVALCCSLFSYL